jgi:predicted metal-dependent hydrolase
MNDPSPEAAHASPRDEAGLFHLGLKLFNDGDYFNAHEAWEDAWHQVSGQRKDFYQGMIQCAVALEHVRRGNPRGALMVFARAQSRFEELDCPYMGIDWRTLVTRLDAFLAPLKKLPKASLAPRQHGQTLPVDLQRAPRIEPTHDPFAIQGDGSTHHDME